MTDLIILRGKFSEEHCQKCDGIYMSDLIFEAVKSFDGRFILEAVEYETEEDND